jgi:4-amino-4-deoxy-L-arabinose transferase-like glycosyltransferase
MRPPLWLFTGIAIVLVALALFLRLAPISNECVVGDEVFSRRVATSPTPQAWNLIRRDLVHPPLYYLLLKLTLPHGRPASALDIRILSLTAGAASITVVILIGCLAAPLRGPALLAAFLLALNKTHIFYSQQARSYAPFCFLVGALLLWSMLMDRYGQKRTYWLAGTGLMAVLLYTHYFGGFYCAAIVVAVVWTSHTKRFRIQAVASLAIAIAAFLPWVWQEIPAYREKSGLASNLGWHELPAFYDLKMTYAAYLGAPDFRGAGSLVCLLGAVLIVIALLPEPRNKDAALDSGAKLALALTALMPPLLMFFLTRWPFRLPIYSERHVFPSVLAALLLVCYGLWRLASLTSPRLRVPVLVAGAIALSVLQALPVWSQWPAPSRVPYAALAERLRHTNFPVYTTDPYGIGEPVLFYLEPGRPIDKLPAGPAKLPDRCIVLYRPAEPREASDVRPVLGQFDIVGEEYYAGANATWGTRLLVLRKR